MNRVVFDIETVGCALEDLDERSRDYFLQFCDSVEGVQKVREQLNCYPLTAQIVALAMMETDHDRGAVYFQHGGNTKAFKEGGFAYIPCSEMQILEHFWKQMERFEQFITFNGRMFDCPFLMIRSAVRGIPCARNLLPYRYSSSLHIDLADQLSFYDAFRRKFPLHLWCEALGVESPKAHGVDGHRVPDLFAAGEYESIARYCLRDVHSTRELFRKWERFLCVS
ncbi:MAG TPA: ribonuclease H-like domain-containing protein [Candidatus Omnitrophota bacterium]|nr:ribonuclease H-like domain-containing protein [Candidatus Omnitrophota bacterium]